MNIKKSIQTVSFSILASAIFMTSAQAVIRTSGATTPNNIDFPISALNYLTMSSGYNDPNIDRMFLETFKIKKCKVATATFTIKLKRLGAQNYNDALHLVSNGTSYHGVTNIWSSNNVSSPLTINYNFSPSNLMKISNGRFSFLVQDDTEVKSAKLVYSCSTKPMTAVKPVPAIKIPTIKPLEGRKVKRRPGKSWDLKGNVQG